FIGKHGILRHILLYLFIRAAFAQHEPGIAINACHQFSCPIKFFHIYGSRVNTCLWIEMLDCPLLCFSGSEDHVESRCGDTFTDNALWTNDWRNHLLHISAFVVMMLLFQHKFGMVSR